MAQKGRKSTKAEAEAGRKNLMAYLEKNPVPALKHGGYSATMKKRYMDRRTRQGKRLQAVMDSLIDQLGGQSEISAAQQAHLNANVRPKLIVIMCIADYIDRLPNLIDESTGELNPALGRYFIAYSNSLRLDLLALNQMADRKPSRLPRIEDLIGKDD